MHYIYNIRKKRKSTKSTRFFYKEINVCFLSRLVNCLPKEGHAQVLHSKNGIKKLISLECIIITVKKSSGKLCSN